MNDDDDVIDLARYRDRDTLPHGAGTERPSFSVFGGDGDRSRFALPIWHSIYLVGGRRGALVWVPRGRATPPAPEFMLDLDSDPARTEFELQNAGAADSCDPPMVLEAEAADYVAVFLGVRGENNWFLLLDDYDPAGGGAGYARGDLLFWRVNALGLIFFRELTEAGEKLDGE